MKVEELATYDDEQREEEEEKRKGFVNSCAVFPNRNKGSFATQKSGKHTGLIH